VFDGELLIGHGKEFGIEFGHIWSSSTLNIACPPTAIDKFPFSVVNLDCIPGVTCIVRWKRCSWAKGAETVSFPMTTDYY
jgi:hypothetical protein